MPGLCSIVGVLLVLSCATSFCYSFIVSVVFAFLKPQNLKKLKPNIHYFAQLFKSISNFSFAFLFVTVIEHF